ncbi:hypothetical protein AB6N23_14085, partial [Cellulomonas sp. 179-A 9B4 NHS]
MPPPVPTDTVHARSLRALLDATRCPACAATLPGPRCAGCGLDVSTPEAALLWQDSVAAADALRRREERIAAMRTAAARREAVRATAAPDEVALRARDARTAWAPPTAATRWSPPSPASSTVGAVPHPAPTGTPAASGAVPASSVPA